MHVLADCPLTTVQDFVLYVPRLDDCTVFQTAPITSRSHRSALRKLSVCLTFSMTPVLVQYSTVLWKRCNIKKCIHIVCYFSAAPLFFLLLQKGMYVEIHFLASVTRVYTPG